MKLKLRLILSLACVALICCTPFVFNLSKSKGSSQPPEEPASTPQHTICEVQEGSQRISFNYEPSWEWVDTDGDPDTPEEYIVVEPDPSQLQTSWRWGFTNSSSKNMAVALDWGTFDPANASVTITYAYSYDEEPVTDANTLTQYSTFQNQLLTPNSNVHIYIIVKVSDYSMSTNFDEYPSWGTGDAVTITYDLGDGTTVQGCALAGVAGQTYAPPAVLDNGMKLVAAYSDADLTQELTYSEQPIYRDTTVYAEYHNLPNSWLQYVSNGTNSYYKVVKPANAGANDLPQDLVIPSRYNGHPVTTIQSAYNASAFGSQNITSVTLPRTITDMGQYAFYNNTTLQTVKFRNGFTTIGYGAFYGCTSLTSINIPSSVTSIVGNTFWDCSGLTSVHITDIDAWCRISFGNSNTGYTSGVNPLEYAKNLYLNGELVTEVTIPSGITTISSGHFYNCTSLTKVTIPSSVTSIGVLAFTGCNQLTAVHITDLDAWCRISFGDSAANPLGWAENLYLNGALVTEVDFPEGTAEIKPYIFTNCTSLTKVTIPSSVTSVGNYAFYNCNNLSYYEYDNAYYLGNDNDPYMILWKKKSTSITSCEIHSTTRFIHSNAFYGSASITSITIPNSVTSIGSDAFYGCTSLSSIIIPDSVTNIGSSVFSGCSGLTSVTIGSGITSIDSFGTCSSLTTITIHATTPPKLSYSNSLPSATQLTAIYIPAGTIDAYKAATNWKNYADKFVEMD